MSFDDDLALIGHCPVCQQGRLFVSREIARGTLCVACEDCECEWDSPDLAADSQQTRGPLTTEAPSQWVTVGELRGHPWFAAVLNK